MAHNLPDPGTPQSVRDWGASWIRTTVPVAWGFLLTFLATRWPALYAALDNPALIAAVSGALTAAWYTLWRAVEPHLPAFLTALVLGSNRRPTYPGAASGPAAAQVTIPSQADGR